MTQYGTVCTTESYAVVLTYQDVLHYNIGKTLYD